jgi:serine/threonine protein kinase
MISTNKASIGRYEILGEIGRGAMGVVYKARDPHIDRVVAIKTISLFDLEPTDEKEYRERFQQEARTAGRLSHPGIVAIFDVGADPETNAPYLVMEFIAGSSLTKLLADDHGKLPLPAALQIVEEIAEALDYAHSEGVTHRDVKPANILLTPEGRAKLADFGIARLDQSHLTLPGRLMGSPAYMAPEQMRGEAVDGRSDLFALGVVLYRLSTGYRPFQGNSTATVCYKLLRQDPLPASALNSDLPPELDEFLVRAMAKDPDQRFQSGKEMAVALRELRKIAELKQDPLEPLRRIIDRTGVSHAPVVPKEPIIFEIPLADIGADAPSKVPNVDAKQLSPPSVVAAKLSAKKPDPWLKIALVAAPVVAILAGALLWGAHRHAVSAAQEAQEIQGKTSAPVVPVASAVQPDQPPVPAIGDHPLPAAPVKNERPVQRKRARPITDVKSADAAGNASEPSEQPIVVHHMDFAKLDVVIEHGFEDATVSVLVDQKPLYSQELHGESKRRALLFKRTQGKESGSINLLPGKHDIVVRVQSPADGYDASKTLSEGFSQGSSRVLRIKCDKHKNKLDAVIQ